MRDQIVKFTKTATENYTEATDKVLDAVVENNKKAVDFAVKTADQMAEQLPEFPVELPWADQVPTPAELGARYIDFVERAVELNREFTDRVIAALQLDEVEVAAPAPAKKSTAKKSTAKKSTAKKSTAKKSTAKKSTAKKSTAKKAAAPDTAAG
jgi:DNA-binding MltR family transcriptional regulator